MIFLILQALSLGLKSSGLICPVSYYGIDVLASDFSTQSFNLRLFNLRFLVEEVITEVCTLKCPDLKVSVEKSMDGMSCNRTQNWFGCEELHRLVQHYHTFLNNLTELAIQIQNSNLVASKTLAPHTVGIDPLLSHGFCFVGNVENPSRQLSSSNFLSIIS